MAFDGITVAALVKELKAKTDGTRIYKIAQPEKDELLLTIKGNSTQFRILLSADATLPLVYITNDNKPSPQTAPNFCMLLRKHLTNAKILDVTQPGLERVIRFDLEHLDEMGDLKKKSLIIELMGKYSNIIFTDEDDNIIDSVKHISHNISSVREVLPGRKWFIPGSDEKLDALSSDKEQFVSKIMNAHLPVAKAIYGSYTGFSPIMAGEICHRAGIDAESSTSSLETGKVLDLWKAFEELTNDIRLGSFAPEIVLDKNIPVEYGVFPLSIYEDLDKRSYDDVSSMLIDYYKEKIVTTALERNIKKLDLQQKQLKDTEKRDKYKVYGELINTYGYNVPEGAKSFECDNYYTGEKITIPLDPTLSAKDNAKKYFDKYGKLKRTAENLTTIIEDVEAEVAHLRSVLNSLDIAVLEDDLSEIREELVNTGYIRFKATGKKKKPVSEPLHYISSDGFDIYVGKNNLQNDHLTFELANGNDWWFHAKKMPGSHVILKTDGKEVPDRAFEEAAKLAAYYSSGRSSEKVEIDYTVKKNIKKPANAKPGFVVYYTNYSMVMDTDISGIQKA